MLWRSVAVPALSMVLLRPCVLCTGVHQVTMRPSPANAPVLKYSGVAGCVGWGSASHSCLLTPRSCGGCGFHAHPLCLRGRLRLEASACSSRLLNCCMRSVSPARQGQNVALFRWPSTTTAESLPTLVSPLMLCCREFKSSVRYMLMLRAVTHDAPMLWIVGDFLLQEGPTTYYVTTYALALFGVLIIGTLMRITTLHEAGNFFPVQLCTRQPQRLLCGCLEVNHRSADRL